MMAGTAEPATCSGFLIMTPMMVVYQAICAERGKEQSDEKGRTTRWIFNCLPKTYTGTGIVHAAEQADIYEVQHLDPAGPRWQVESSNSLGEQLRICV